MNNIKKWLGNLGWFKDKDGKRYKKVYEDLYNYLIEDNLNSNKRALEALDNIVMYGDFQNKEWAETIRRALGGK